MKYDLSKTFDNALGQKFLKEDKTPETFQSICTQCLLADVDGNNQPVRGGEKLKRFDLWMKIKQAEGEVELDSEQIQLLSSAAEIFSTILYGQFKYFLEQKN